MAKAQQLVFMQVTITGLGSDLYYVFKVIDTRTQKEKLVKGNEDLTASPDDQFSFIVGPTQHDVDKTSVAGGETTINMEFTSENKLKNCTSRDRRVTVAARAAMDGCMCLAAFPEDQRTWPQVKSMASTAAKTAFCLRRDMAISEEKAD